MVSEAVPEGLLPIDILQETDTTIRTGKIGIDETRINNILRNPAIINMASDGSYDPGSGIMSYGWVVAVNETIIAKGKGPAERHQDVAQLF
jgi:hypothetical protein